MNPNPSLSPPLPEAVLDTLADALWDRIVGANLNPIAINLQARLALEQKLLCAPMLPFGLDKLGTDETAAYLGVRSETLQDKHKRRVLGAPEPYSIGRKLFWRRSELDAWIETKRPTEAR